MRKLILIALLLTGCTKEYQEYRSNERYLDYKMCLRQSAIKLKRGDRSVDYYCWETYKTCVRGFGATHKDPTEQLMIDCRPYPKKKEGEKNEISSRK